MLVSRSTSVLAEEPSGMVKKIASYGLSVESPAVPHSAAASNLMAIRLDSAVSYPSARITPILSPLWVAVGEASVPRV